MKAGYQINFIEEADAADCLAIYAPYVTDTVITFEYEVPSSGEFSERINHITETYPWLVCRHNGKVIGYAYASQYRGRIAYQWSVEITIYILPEYHRKGVARSLYAALLAILRIQGFYTVYAIIGYPNEQSVGFHSSMGFEAIGVFKKSGYKHGQWRDTIWMQLNLATYKENPTDPLGIKMLRETGEVRKIIEIMESD